MNILAEVRQHWSWTGIKPNELIGQNEFGNLLIKDTNGAFWRICPEELSCEAIARDATDLSQLVHTEEFRIDWEMSNLVDLARKSLGPLEANWVYYLVTPAVLGGRYDVSNIRAIPLSELIGHAGSLAQQIKDLPDGAQIKMQVTD